MKFSYLLLGLAALLPASILLFSLLEFSVLKLDGGFFDSVFSALYISFVAIWSVYIVSIGQLLKNKQIPTSLEGMWTTAAISIGFAVGFVLFEEYVFKIEFTPYTYFVTFFGILASCAIQGFYTGFSKARHGDDEPIGFVFRQLGLVESTLVLTPFIFVSFKIDDDLILAYSYIFMIVTCLVLAMHYVRATRQSRNYTNRRHKVRSNYAGKEEERASYSEPAAV
jgi:hypothetical protein